MLILGVILAVIGWLTGISLLVTIGIVLVIIGAILLVVGMTGHVAGGRRYWY